MVDIEIVREWIEKANEDFEFDRINLKEGSPFFAQICFSRKCRAMSSFLI